MKLDKNAHSVFLLDYHVVFVVKYRRKVFDNNISERAKEIFEHISPKYNKSGIMMKIMYIYCLERTQKLK